jgi:hypothetical protein
VSRQGINGFTSTPDTLNGLGYLNQNICVLLGKRTVALGEKMFLKAT